jgi:hypothetical protein
MDFPQLVSEKKRRELYNKTEIMNDGMFCRWQSNYNNRGNDNQGSQKERKE